MKKQIVYDIYKELEDMQYSINRYKRDVMAAARNIDLIELTDKDNDYKDFAKNEELDRIIEESERVMRDIQIIINRLSDKENY